MPLTVLLDVDDTLRMTHQSAEGGRYRALNQTLVDGLKASGVKEVYFLTNMDLSDSAPSNREVQTDEERMTRKILIDELQRQGIKVKAVLTVADVAYGKGPGAAYKDLYTAAYATKKKEDHQTYQTRWHAYASQPYDTATVKPTREEQAAFQKEQAFRYFLAHMSDEELGTLLYADDDISCLQKIDSVAQARQIPMKLIVIKPVEYQTVEEQAKYKLLLQDANPFGAVLAHYRNFVGSYSFSTHNPKGLQTAEGFIKQFNKLTDPEERSMKIIEFLEQGKHSTQNLHSFKSILLAHLLGKDIKQDAQLKEVGDNYAAHVNAYRQQITAVATSSTSLSEDALIESNDDIAGLTASESDDFPGEIPESPKFS
ncbi:MAG: hypothetical protein P4L79_15825 [Legionella sp.]|uniref:hypothetical protein n=1 Tax=Legionella sp. TaxID=459 RepID=UPI00284142AF|nr:hypothetical protein [Legionella sp.]